MKTRTFFIICFLFVAFCNVNAQKISESKVPQDVVISFKYKFPDATVSYWEKSDGNYVSKFKREDQVGKAEFDEKGLWIKTRTEVKEKELPSPISTYYKENYYKLEYVMSTIEMHRTSQGESFYYVQLKKEGATQVQPVELHFDLTGALIYKNDPGLIKIENESNENPKQNKDNTNKTNVNNTNNYTVVKNQPEDDSKFIVDASKVPSAAKTHFLGKNKKAAGTVWYLKDNKYNVKFNTAGKNGSASYTKEGAWIETRIESSEDKLNQLATNYLKDNYRQYTIKSVEFVTQPKDKSIYIRMFDKRSRAVPPPITEIWFTSAGKFVNVEKPEITDPNELEEQKRRDAKDNEFMSHVDQGGSTYENADNYNDKVDKKELPSSIIIYIKQNFKDQVISSSRLVSDDKLGNVYLIRVKVEGAKYGTQLYFDIAGNLLKKIDETESRITGDNYNKGNKTDVTEDTGPQYGTPEEKVSVGELPSDITKYIKKNYPNHIISQSYFKTDDELGNCYLLIMKKSGEKKITKLFFDLDGYLLKTLVENM